MGWAGRQQHLNQALLRISRRAESTDRATLTKTFVTAGSFSAMLHSADHQIIYGRRGTGKTHALLYLSDLVDSAGDLAVYLDLRTIGSAGGLYADRSLSTAVRGTQLLIDTLEAVHEELLTLAIDRELGDTDVLLPGLDALAEAATAVEVVGEVESELRAGVREEAGHELQLGGPPLSAKVSLTQRRAVCGERRVRRTGTERNRLVFGPLNRALRAITSGLGGRRIWLLLDEWSSLPLDLQPLLADLLRRCVLPTPGITVKIAAIERRSRFRQRWDGDHLGIEVGADAASAVSLDDVLIFDASRTRAQQFFAQLFHNHAGELLTRMIADPPRDPDTFIGETFSGNAFGELLRAAEGVPRDAINIAALAAQHAHDEPIGLHDVRLAARDWFLRDKQRAISGNEPALRLLRLLVDEVVGRRHSRTFLLDQLAGPRHEMVEDLYDARLLHVLRRGLTDPRRPGVLYDGYAIDYGCYVGLLLNRRSRPHARGDWLKLPKGVPPDGFSLAQEAINLDRLGPDP